MRNAAPDEIEIEGLEIWTRIGVTEEERTEAQRLLADVTIVPRKSFATADDRLENTVDYGELCQRIEAYARENECQLLETLAESVAAMILAEFAVAEITLRLRKFVLPGTKHVAVRIRRTR